MAAVEAAFGRVDVLAHLVGGWTGGTAVADLDQAEVRRMLDQHLWTTLHVLQARLPGMASRGFGRVVACRRRSPRRPARAARATRWRRRPRRSSCARSRREHAADGVTANILVRPDAGRRAVAGRPAEREDAGWTTPEELAEAIAWLASPAAAAVNGARIPLDGRG